MVEGKVNIIIMLKAINIKWDIDLEDEETYEEALENRNLPTEVKIPEDIDDEENISDWLSDEFGYLHYGFNIESTDFEVENSCIRIPDAINCVLNIEFLGDEIRITKRVKDEILATKAKDDSSHNLYEIQTKCGVIYIESLFNNREEYDRIKIYDSDRKYIDYLPLETLQNCANERGLTLEEEYAGRIEDLRNTYDNQTLFCYISEAIINWSKNKKDFESNNNDYINRIGEYWVLVRE